MIISFAAGSQLSKRFTYTYQDKVTECVSSLGSTNQLVTTSQRRLWRRLGDSSQP
jgi:hypothetical protein